MLAGDSEGMWHLTVILLQPKLVVRWIYIRTVFLSIYFQQVKFVVAGTRVCDLWGMDSVLHWLVWQFQNKTVLLYFFLLKFSISLIFCFFSLYQLQEEVSKTNISLWSMDGHEQSMYWITSSPAVSHTREREWRQRGGITTIQSNELN